MFGLDERIAALSNGSTIAVVLVVSILLGLRHASDPDHLTAVTTLVASGRERAVRGAARLGCAWGAGHATSLFVLGVPIVLYRAYLPEPVQSAAETLVGLVIVALAVALLVRWRRGVFRHHPHVHHHVRTRTSRGAFAIGVVHGIGGSAGVGVLLLASIRSHALALASLGVFAGCTALSMAALSSGFGMTLAHRRVRTSFTRLAPALAACSLAFGTWYVLGAQGLLPYVL